MRVGNRKTHGLSQTRQYGIWVAMRHRCQNPTYRLYKDYGGRGISVDSLWDSFENFWEDMKGGYTNEMTIERVDVDGNYCKENCIWIPRVKQNRNKRNVPLYLFDGVTLTLPEVASAIGLNYHTLYQRMFKLGMSFEKATTLKCQKNKRPNKYKT